MSKNYFVSHFLLFQINTTIFIFVIFFTKWLSAAILDIRKSLSVAFLAISDQYATLFVFEIFIFVIFLQNGCRQLFWMSENHIRSHFWPFQTNTQLFLNFILQNRCRRSFWMSEIHFGSHFWLFYINTYFIFNKMAAGGHFGCPKITFDLISGHFRSIRNFIFIWNFWQNGCRRPFWMFEIHFGSHFWPF